MKIDFNELKNLDPNNPASWPGYFKAFVVFLVFVGVIFAGYYFDTSGQIDTLNSDKAREKDLKVEFEKKQAKAANLDAYMEQMKEMEDSFGTMLRQLPSKTEVADLLVDITQTGLAAGLEFELFRPMNEIPREFYAELPIKIIVKGTYHQFGEFVSGVAALPRIVSLHDIHLIGGKSPMEMEATAKTYRYLDDNEIKANRRRRR